MLGQVVQSGNVSEIELSRLFLWPEMYCNRKSPKTLRPTLSQGWTRFAAGSDWDTLDLLAPDPFRIMLSKGGSLWKV